MKYVTPSTHSCIHHTFRGIYLYSTCSVLKTDDSYKKNGLSLMLAIYFYRSGLKEFISGQEAPMYWGCACSLRNISELVKIIPKPDSQDFVGLT